MTRLEHCLAVRITLYVWVTCTRLCGAIYRSEIRNALEHKGRYISICSGRGSQCIYINIYSRVCSRVPRARIWGGNKTEQGDRVTVSDFSNRNHFFPKLPRSTSVILYVYEQIYEAFF